MNGFSKGFTLIEVLVVVAIIALLIAILLPSLNRARIQSRAAVCASNLHQAGLAVATYAVEYHDYVPRGGNVEDYFTSGDTHWTIVLLRQIGVNTKAMFQESASAASPAARGQLFHNLLWAKLKQIEVFHCPEWVADSGSDTIAVNYLVNAFDPNAYASNVGFHDVRPPTKISTWHRPAETVYACDMERLSEVARTRDNGIWRAYEEKFLSPLDVFAPEHLPGAGKGTRRVARGIHMNRKTNAAFVDGHSAPINSLPETGEPEFDASGTYSKRWQRLFGVKTP